MTRTFIRRRPRMLLGGGRLFSKGRQEVFPRTPPRPDLLACQFKPSQPSERAFHSRRPILGFARGSAHICPAAERDCRCRWGAGAYTKATT